MGDIASGVAAAIVFSLAIAAAIRGIYVKVRKRPFWSPWLFVVAALLAFFSYVGQVGSEESATNNEAVARAAQAETSVSPHQRCVTKILQGVETAPPEQRARIPGNIRSFAGRFCARADIEGVLATSGDLYQSDAFDAAICAEGAMTEFRRIPSAERAFTATDFRLFADRYCEQAVSRDLFQGARAGEHRKELDALQQEVLNDLLEEGKIRRIR